jgi:ATP-dependent DNA helicase MPH1
MLNEHSSLIKATKFVGQAQGKKEDDRGFKQKEQKQVG